MTVTAAQWMTAVRGYACPGLSTPQTTCRTNTAIYLEQIEADEIAAGTGNPNGQPTQRLYERWSWYFPAGTQFDRSPSTDTVSVSDFSLDRVLSAVRVPSTDSSTVTDSSLTRILSATRAPGTDSSTVTDATLTRSRGLSRVPSTDSSTVTDSSLVRMLSATRAPSTDILTIGESRARVLSALRLPSSDSITVVDSSLVQQKTLTRTGSDTTGISDSSLTRLLSAIRVPSLDTITVTDGSTTRMLSAARIVNVVSYDDFEAGTYSFTEAGNSPNGKWTNMFLGGTGASSGVRFTSSINSNVMWLEPQAPTSAGETHATENKSTSTWGNFDATFKMRTIEQLRTGSAPNAWETAWVIFRYTDDWHHYYFTIKTTGCELGRKDYLPHVEQQMFLATPGSPTVTMGQWYKVRIRAIRNHFEVWVDDTLIIDMVDDGSVGFDTQTSGLPPPPTAALYSGLFNLYSEDAEVEFDEIAIGDQDYVTIAEQVVGGKVYGRIPSTDSTTIADSAITRLLSALRTPSDTTSSSESLIRILSASRVTSSDTTTVADTSILRSRSLIRAPSTDTATVVDISLVRMLQAFRSPSQDTVLVSDSSLIRIKSALRLVTAETTTVSESIVATQSQTIIRTASDSTAVTDVTLNRILSALRVPSTETVTIADSSIVRLLQLVRVVGPDTIATSESISSAITTPGLFSRTASDTVAVAEASLIRLLSSIRTGSDSSPISENLVRSVSRIRAPATDSRTIADVSVTRVRSLTRLPTQDTMNIIETSLIRLLSLRRIASDTTVVTEVQNAITHSRALTETVNVTEPLLQRVVTFPRSLNDITDITEAVFYQTWHRYVFDTVDVGEQLFSERQALSGSVTYAVPDEVRPLLGNIGPTQRTDAQIELAIDAAYDEINTKTNRIPPNDWKETDHNFGLVKKLTRYIAAKECAIGIKDFDTKPLEMEIEHLFNDLLTYDTSSDATQDIVGSSPDVTYALNDAGLIWSVRYKNLRKGGSGENDTTINPNT